MTAITRAIPSFNRAIAPWDVRRAASVRRVWMTLRALAPYAAIELLLPGGTLIAIAYWLYRRYKRTRSSAPLLDAVGNFTAPAAR